MGAPVSVKANAPAGRAEAFVSSQEVSTLQHFDLTSEVLHERNESSVSAISDKRAHSGDCRPNQQNQEDAEFRSPFSIRGRRSDLSRTLGATGRARSDGSCSPAEAHDSRRTAPLARLGACSAVLTPPESIIGFSRRKLAAGSRQVRKSSFSHCADQRIGVSSFHCQNPHNLFINNKLEATILLDTPCAEGRNQQLGANDPRCQPFSANSRNSSRRIRLNPNFVGFLIGCRAFGPRSDAATSTLRKRSRQPVSRRSLRELRRRLIG